MKPYRVFKYIGFWWFAEVKPGGKFQIIAFERTLESLWQQAAHATQLVQLRAI